MVIATLSFAAATPAAAQADSPWRLSASAFYGGQSSSDLDAGGEVGLTFGGLTFGVDYAQGRQWSAGLRLSATRYRFDFSGSGPIAGLNPWDDVTTTTIGLPLFYAFDERWSLFVQPIAQNAGTSDADRAESRVYGATAALNYAVGPRQRVGLGAGYFTGLEEGRVVPLLLVDWQFDEHWRLANPLPAGPAGGAGLELVRSFGDGWEASVGGAYRSLRFRLDENLAVAPNGIGQYSGTLAFFRVAKNFGRDVSLDFYAGADFSGRIRLYDAQGNTLRSDNVGTAPLLAVSLSGRF